MNKIPEKFPEQIIMYKILTKKISELRKRNKTNDEEFREIQIKIENYEREQKSESHFLKIFLQSTCDLDTS